MKIEKDEFNSKIFNLKMGNIVDANESLSLKEIDNIIQNAYENKYQHLSIKVPTNQKENLNNLIQKGFSLVDTQIMFLINTNQPNSTEKNEIIIRDYVEDNKECIANIAKQSFSIDRYHSDKSLDDSLCDYYYSKWAENSCEGLSDKVLVAYIEHKVCGFITINYHDKSATIGLAAVDAQYRGKGIFTALIKRALKELNDKNINALYYGTQLENKPILKAMGHLGGVICNSNYVLHLSMADK